MCTPLFFSAKQGAHLDKHKEDKEEFRMLAFIMAKVAGDKSKTLHSFMPLPWDAKPKEFEAQTEKQKAVRANFDKSADDVLKTANPEAYAAYMAGKNK
jgi:hypothetical protein